MKRIFPLIISLLLLSGCSVLSSWQNSMSNRFDGTATFGNFSGGDYDGQIKSFYWLTISSSQPKTASDFVELSDGTWYKTTYQWQNGVIKEIVRQGKVLQEDNYKLVPFLAHIRFSTDGEAVYQRYRIDNQILPLSQVDFDSYAQDAEKLLDKVEDLHSQNLELIQGMWNGEIFESCDGVQYNDVQFAKTSLPAMVKQRINGLTSYAAFVGTSNHRHKTILVTDLLIFDKASHGCITRPNLIVTE